MRKLSDLVRDRDKAWIYIADDDWCQKFIAQAIDEGYTLSKGQAIPENATGKIFEIDSAKTLGYVAIFSWWMSFSNQMQNTPLRVDYDKYARGEKEYESKEPHLKKVYLQKF